MFAERLKEARKAKRYSQAEVSRMLGVTQQAVGKWETGRSTPDPQTVARLAEILDTPADVLLGLRKEPDASSAVGRNAFSRYTESQVPVVGTVRAGYGALAFEEDYGKEYACVKDPENYFFLVVKGDSMEPRISDGDLALVHRQNTLDNGDLGVLVYGSDGEGTLKSTSSAATRSCCTPLTRPMRKWSSRGRSWITFTSQARSWRPRPSGDFSLRIYIVA